MFPFGRSLLAVILLWLATVARAAFTFSLGAPTQCDNVTVSWTGGQAPYILTLFPVFGRPTNISIPADAFSNGQGSFQTQITVAAGLQFLATMSDATGFNSGGTTDLITVGQSQGGSCNTTSPVDFNFELDSALVQCRTYTFSKYDNATQPVTIYALIPGGDVLTFYPPVGQPEYEWIADAAAGTSFVFSMVDALGNQGGSSDIKLVGASDDSTCLGSTSPTTTANPPAASTTGPSSSNTPSPSDSSKPSVALVVGTILGAIVFLACIGSMVVFCVRRRLLASNYPYRNRNSRNSRALGSVDLLNTTGSGAHATDGGSYPYPYPGDSPTTERVRSPFDDPEPTSRLPPGHQPEPFTLTTPTPTSTSFHTRRTSQDGPGDDGRSRQTSGAGRRSKAAMAGIPSYATPSRFILHTDLDEAVPDADGVIELPPQYVEGRRPLAIPVAPAPVPAAAPPPPPPPPHSPPTPSLSLSMGAFSDAPEDPFAGLHFDRLPSGASRSQFSG